VKSLAAPPVKSGLSRSQSVPRSGAELMAYKRDFRGWVFARVMRLKRSSVRACSKAAPYQYTPQCPGKSSRALSPFGRFVLLYHTQIRGKEAADLLLGRFGCRLVVFEPMAQRADTGL
jgi:hypothetical protein